MKLLLGQVAEFTGGQGEFGRDVLAEGYSIDSRTLGAGELFFALRGERLDGHDFVEQALARGAVAAVVAKEQAARFAESGRLLRVPDTLAALHVLGTSVRRLWGKTLIAVTGSTGKTTTKEAIAHVLAGRLRVFKSEGNLNNHFGLPLQLLRLEPEHEIGVVELGMSHAGEIAALTALAQPNIGVVTNVAPVHLSFFDSVAQIARAKYELIAGLPQDGCAVLNADDEYVSQFGLGFAGRVVTFGMEHAADVRADAVTGLGSAGSEFDLVAEGARLRARVPLLGRHNIYNALASVAVALRRGFPPAEAAARLDSLVASDKRGQVLELAGATVINDCYNSNPRALEAMVATLAGMQAKRRIVVAGEMLELGPTGDELHHRAGRYMAQRGVDAMVGVRGAARQMVEGARLEGLRAEFVETPEEAGQWLARHVRPGDVVLLKASRGVRLEQALEAWRARLETTTAR